MDRKKSTAQYKTILAGVRPRDPAGKTRRRIAAGQLADLDRIDAQLKALKGELKEAVQATGSHLMDIHGIGPVGAARILADVVGMWRDVARFPDHNHFASPAGTAPIDASSGDHVRHRLSRAGNRRMNHVLYIPGIVQLRNDTDGRAYYRRKLAQSNDQHGSPTLPSPAPVRRRLPETRRRRPAACHAAGPGRALPGRLMPPARPT